jgi:O-antigen ligase
MIALLGPLVHWNSFADAYSIPRYFLLSLLCLSVALSRKPRRGTLSVVSFLYLTVLFAVSLWSLNVVSFVGTKLNFFTGFFPSCLIACVYHYSIGEDYEKIVDSFLMGCVIVALIGICQHIGLFMPQGDYFGGRRVYACMGNPVFLSGLLGMAIPLCLGHSRRPFAIPLLLACIILTQSRAGLLSAALGCLGYGFARGAIGRKPFALLAIFAAVACFGMFSGLRDTGKSDKGRYHMARLALKSIKEHPMMGVGPERFGWVLNHYRDEAMVKDLGDHWHNAYVHNSVLEALVTGGIPLLLAYGLLIFSIFAYLLRWGTPQLLGSGMALLAFSLAQPVPLIYKAIFASLLASLEPFSLPERTFSSRPFILTSALAFYSSLGALVMARIWVNGQYYGLANMVAASFEYSPSAKEP